MAREKAEPVERVEKQDTQQRGVGKEATSICMPLMRKTANTRKKQNDGEEDLQAWCVLEESENEQRQERWSANGKSKRGRGPIKRH